MPAYATTSLDLDPDSVPRLRSRLLAGPGSAAFEGPIAAYRTAAGDVSGVAEELALLLHRHTDAHAGAAADATRRHLEALLTGIRADADALARAAVALQDQAVHHETARREAAAAEPAPRTGAAALLDAVLTGPGHAPRARQALAVYQHNSNHTLTTALPEFGGAGTV